MYVRLKCKNAKPICELVSRVVSIVDLAFTCKIEHGRFMEELWTLSFHLDLTLKMIPCTPHIDCNMIVRRVWWNCPPLRFKVCSCIQRGTCWGHWISSLSFIDRPSTYKSKRKQLQKHFITFLLLDYVYCLEKIEICLEKLHCKSELYMKMNQLYVHGLNLGLNW